VGGQPVAHAVAPAAQADRFEVTRALLRQFYQPIDPFRFRARELQQTVDVASHEAGLLAFQQSTQRAKRIALHAQTLHETGMIGHGL
jgi:hypothetical protein